MDMDITIERLMNDLEGVLSQINDIVAKKDIKAAERAMQQIADIVRADDPDIELDTNVNPDYDHVLHELLSRIDGVIKTKGERITVIDETQEAIEAERQLRLIETEIEEINIEINDIRRSRKSTTRVVGSDEEETETVEDQTLDEINKKINELTRQRIELYKQWREQRETEGIVDDRFVDLKNQIDELNKQITELEAQRTALKAQANLDPNVNIDELTRQLDELRGQVSKSEDEIKGEITTLAQEIEELRKNATYIEQEREPNDAFEMRHRNFDIKNFAAGTKIRIGGKEITLDPAIHRFRQEFAQEINGGEEAGLGPTGEIILEEIDPEVLRQIEEKRKAIDERQLSLQNRKAIFDKIAELEAQLEAAKLAKSKNTHDRIIALEEEIATLEQKEYREVGRDAGDSFEMRYRNLNINNFAAGTQIRIGDKDVTLDPAIHRFKLIHAQELHGGEEENGPVGAIVLEEVDPTVKQELDAKRKELTELLESLVPDKTAELDDINNQLKTLKEKARTLGEQLQNLKSGDENYDRIYEELARTNEQIRILEERKRNLLQINPTRTKKGPTKVIKSDEKLTKEQQERIKILLARKQELLKRQTEVLKLVKKHKKVVVTGEDKEYSLTAVARELGDPFFKTHAIRQELAERGVTDEDYLRFYQEGMARFKDRYEELDAQILAIQQEAANLALGPNGENLSLILDNENISKEDKLKALEMLRKNFFNSEKFKTQMTEAGFDKELTEENMEKFAEFFEKFQKDTVLTLRNMQEEAHQIDYSIKVLAYEIDIIQRGQQAELAAKDDGKAIRDEVEEDKKLRDAQIAATMFGNPEMEAKWDETVKRFCSHRKVADKTFEVKKSDGTVVKVNYDTIEDYDGREADAHFLNLDDYKKFLELVTAYDNAEKVEKGLGLKLAKEKFDFFTDNPKFAAAYRKLRTEKGQEAADRLLLEYINEKKEYVKTFHGLTNRDAVKYATLRTAGSTLTAMRPVRGNLPVPVKAGNAVANVFRFAGLRWPFVTKVDANGDKKIDAKGSLGRAAVDLLVFGFGAAAIASGPVGIATWGAAYGIRGIVTAGNVIAGHNYYKKHKDVIDAGYPTLAEPPEYVKEVSRRDHYREQIMQKTGKPGVGIFRTITTWAHAKSDRLPFRKAAREATNKAVVEAQQGRMHTEIDEDAERRIEVSKKNAELAQKNRDIRNSNKEKEARSQVSYNSVFRNPDQTRTDAMLGDVAVNAALRSRGASTRIDLGDDSLGTAEQVGAGRYKRPDEVLEQTSEMQAVPKNKTTMNAVTAITEEEHYKGEKEHRDFWNRAITIPATILAGMGIRAAYNKWFIESRVKDPGTPETEKTVHHDAETKREWVDGHKEQQTVQKEVTDYSTQYDLKGRSLEDVTAANDGKQVTGYNVVSGGKRGPQTVTISKDDKITAMWQDDGSKWGTGVGDTAGLNQNTGFIDRTVETAMMDGNGVMNQTLKVDQLVKAVGEGKVDPATLDGTYVSIGDNCWVSLKKLMEGMTTEVPTGTRIETITQDVFVPGKWIEKIIPASDEIIKVPGTPATYEDVVNWQLVLESLGRSAMAGAAVGAIDLQEAAKETVRTSKDGIGRNGGRFTDRNGILARSSEIMSKMVEQQKAEVMKKRAEKKKEDKKPKRDEEPEI